MAKKKFNDHPFPYHHELELEVSTLTNLGVGLGRVPLPGDGPDKPRAGSSQQRDMPSSIQPASGWVVMVPFTLPGEKVRVKIYRNHKNFSEADLLAVLAPSPHRIAPRCPLFGRCGGCQYQHLTYAEQLKWKRRQVEELLKHMAGVEFAVAPVIASPREFGYRSKITPHFQAPRFFGGPVSFAGPRPGQTPGLQQQTTARPAANTSSASQPAGQETGPPAVPPPIGFLKQGSRFELVDVPHCDIATPEINAALPAVRAKTHQRLAAGEYKRDATLLLRHAQEGVITDYDAVIHEVVDSQPSTLLPGDGQDKHRADSSQQRRSPQLDAAKPLRLHFLARDFFQNNPFILPAFTGYVREQAAASGARFLVDAYCGSGLFALACAPAFERVMGIEISESSVRFARENAQANGISHATFQAGDAAAIFAGLPFPSADTAVVIDPPRKGCDESFLRQLFAFGPRAVVYVSCDPATQMRDLKNFIAAGYALTAVQPFDLFPQTRHLECVLTLVRPAG